MLSIIFVSDTLPYFSSWGMPSFGIQKESGKRVGVEDIKEKKGCFARRFEHFISDFS